MGSFSTGTFSVEGNDDSKGVWAFFLATTFLSQILIMNMLINMTGEALGEYLPKKKEIAMAATIRLMYDNNVSFLGK